MIPDILDGAGLGHLLARPGLRAILCALSVEGEETRLVGGCVRDALVGRPTADVDLATTLLPADTTSRAVAAGIRAVPTGIDHGTVTLLVEGEPFEVTTLREDIETDGRHAVVRFGRDFARDAERRDFTINALSLSGDGTLHDTTGGAEDLAAGRVRFIGDPATRIREDALRILRFFRFHARYGRGEPDRASLDAAVAARGALAGLSRERVRAELLKILLAPGAVEAVTTLSDTGLFARLIGGVADIGRLGRMIAGGDADGDAVARLAALAVQRVEDADRLRERLRLSKAEHGRLAAYAAALEALRTRETIAADAMRGLVAEHGAAPILEVWQAIGGEPLPRIEADARAVLTAMAGGAARPVLPITGGDLVARGVEPGPGVGIGLAAARALWLAEGCPGDPDARERLLARALAAAHEKPAGLA